MAEVKFGVKQRKHPTPSNIARNIDLFAGCAAAIGAWLGTSAANFIPSKISIPISSILGLLITIALIAKPFFGIKTNQKKVDIEDVSAMDEPKNN